MLERRRRIYPAGHPEIAYALQNLANTLQIQGGYAEAESLSFEALAILRARLGADHPETLELVSNLATLKYEKGDLRGAEAAFRELHAAWRRSLGEDHPTTLQALNDVAAALKYQRQYAEAEPLYREALALRRKRLGESHPDVALAGEIWPSCWPRGGSSPKPNGRTVASLAIYSLRASARKRLHLGIAHGHRRRPDRPGTARRGRAALAGGARAADRQARARRPPHRKGATHSRPLSGGARASRRGGKALLLESYRTLAAATNWYHRTLREHTLQDLVALYQASGRRAEAAKYQALLTGGIERAGSASQAP